MLTESTLAKLRVLSPNSCIEEDCQNLPQIAPSACPPKIRLFYPLCNLEKLIELIIEEEEPYDMDINLLLDFLEEGMRLSLIPAKLMKVAVSFIKNQASLYTLRLLYRTFCTNAPTSIPAIQDAIITALKS